MGTARTTLSILVVEVKGYRGEDAKDKQEAMETRWVPGVNRLGTYGRWNFVELRDVYTMRGDLETRLLITPRVRAPDGTILAGGPRRSCPIPDCGWGQRAGHGVHSLAGRVRVLGMILADTSRFGLTTFAARSQELASLIWRQEKSSCTRW